MTQVFLSYRRDDVGFAKLVRQRLVSWGYDVWMDIHNIKKGAYWPDAIDAGLNSSHIVIGIMSPEGLNSRNVKNEWDWAIVNHRPLILLHLRPSKIPMNYISINYIDFTNPNHHEDAFRELYQGLQSAPIPQVVAPPPPQPSHANVAPRPAQRRYPAQQQRPRQRSCLLYNVRLLVAAVVSAFLVLGGLVFLGNLISDIDTPTPDQTFESGSDEQYVEIFHIENFLWGVVDEDFDQISEHMCNPDEPEFMFNKFNSFVFPHPQEFSILDCFPVEDVEAQDAICEIEFFAEETGYDQRSVYFVLADNLVCDVGPAE